MFTRIWTSLLAISLLLYILWVGLPLFAPLILIVALLGLREYVTMLRKKDIDVRLGSLLVFGAALIIASYPHLPDVPWIGGSWREVVVSVYFIYLMIIESVNPGERPLERVVYSLFGLLYIPWLLGYFIMLRDTPNPADGFGYLLLPLMAAFATDTGALFFGKTFGKHKLAPEVSPGKTVEGMLGGLFFSFVIVFMVGRVLENFLFDLNIYDALLFSLLVSSAAQLGDLAESLLKRATGVKDSGTFMPGHGGVLDRLDSLLFAVPVTYIFITTVVIK